MGTFSKEGSKSISVFAEVTEQFTDIKSTDTQTFTLYEAAFKASPVMPLPFYFDGTELYTFQVRIWSWTDFTWFIIFIVESLLGLCLIFDKFKILKKAKPKLRYNVVMESLWFWTAKLILIVFLRNACQVCLLKSECLNVQVKELFSLRDT